MLISELARRTGVSVHALRHYERQGLIVPERRPNGWRDYPESARREVVFVRMSRRIGFSLAEVAEWLPAYRSGRLTYAQLLAILRERADAIDRQIAQLQAQRQAVVEHIAWVREQQRTQKQRKKAPPRQSARKPWPTVSPPARPKEAP